MNVDMVLKVTFKNTSLPYQILYGGSQGGKVETDFKF